MKNDRFGHLAAPRFDKTNVRFSNWLVVLLSQKKKYMWEVTSTAHMSCVSVPPPPLGAHILMGESSAVKRKNVVENIIAGHIAPVEIIAQKNWNNITIASKFTTTLRSFVALF